MLKAFSVRWLECDETVIKFTEDFENAHYVLKIDILEDAIAELQIKHDKLMQAEENFWEIKKKGAFICCKVNQSLT